jgi:hypothetical protein
LTPWSAVGIVIGFLHFGQGPVRPAYFSLTRNRVRQPVQRTSMGIVGGHPEQATETGN